MTHPAAEPLAAARAIRSILFDVDDTLTTHGKLTAQAYSAMWALSRAARALARPALSYQTMLPGAFFPSVPNFPVAFAPARMYHRK